MGNIIQKWVIRILAVIIFVIALIEYVHSVEGMANFAFLMGKYPFAKMIMKIIKNIIGYQEEIPLISTSGVMYDMVVLLISSVIKSSVVSILLSILCSIPNFDEDALRRAGIDRIDAQERWMRRPGYLFRALLVNVVASLFIIFLSNEILAYIYNYMQTNLPSLVVTVLCIGALALAIVFFVVFICKTASITLGIGIIWLIIGKILPKILDVFGLNVLCLCLYASIYTSGFSSSSFGWTFMILVWCACADVVQKSLTKAIKWT